MIDPDSPSEDGNVVPQVLHYLRTDFSVPEFTSLNSSKPPTLSYVGPGASVGSGPHRYIFLLYVQPDGFSVKGVPGEGNRAGFNVSDWRITNNLQKAISGSLFVATPPGGGGGGNAVSTTSKFLALVIFSFSFADHIGAGTYSKGYVVTETVSCSSTPVPPNSHTTPPPTGSSAPPAPTGAKTISVKVGGPNGLLKYTPESVVANRGDTVFFDFLQVNHTLTQSTLDNPCVFKTGGVRSGFRPNPLGTSGNQTFQVVVADEAPQWFYCAQGQHCKMGMVFAINPGTKFPEFLARAKGNATTSTSGTSPPPPPPTAGTTITGVISNPTGGYVTGTGGYVTATGTLTGTRPTGTGTGTGTGTNGTASGAPVFSGDAVSGRAGFSLAAIAGVLLGALVVV